MPGERRWTQRKHFGDLRSFPSRSYVAAIEAHAEPADVRLRREARAVHAGVRRIELADHEAHDASQLFGALRAGGVRLVLRLDRLPVDAVHLRVEEVVGENAPRLMEHRELLAREVDVDLGGHIDRARLPRLDVDDVDAAVLEVVDLLAVGGELRVRSCSPASTSAVARPPAASRARRASSV